MRPQVWGGKLRSLLAVVLLLGACEAGPPSRSAGGVVVQERGQRSAGFGGDLDADMIAYDAASDRFFIAAETGPDATKQAYLFDVATGKLAPLKLDCPPLLEPGQPIDAAPWLPWTGVRRFDHNRAGVIFENGRLIYRCAPVYWRPPFPPPANGIDIPAEVTLLEQPLQGGAPVAEIITRHTDPPWGEAGFGRLPSGALLAQRSFNDERPRMTRNVIALPGETEFQAVTVSEEICGPRDPKAEPALPCRMWVTGITEGGDVLAQIYSRRPYTMANGEPGIEEPLTGYALLRQEGAALRLIAHLPVSDKPYQPALTGGGAGWIAFRDSSVSRSEQGIGSAVLHLWKPETGAHVRVETPGTGATKGFVIRDGVVSPSGRHVIVPVRRPGQSRIDVLVLPIPQGTGEQRLSLDQSVAGFNVSADTKDIRITRDGRLYAFEASQVRYLGAVK